MLVNLHFVGDFSKVLENNERILSTPSYKHRPRNDSAVK